MTSAASIASPLVVALEKTWAGIGRRHPDVPPAVIVVGSGTAGRRSGLKVGHFAVSRWSKRDREPAKVFVGGEGLYRGPPDVLATLLHEAAHGVAHVRGVADTSRQGRYHNTRYRQLGQELGLEVAHEPSMGWSTTTLATITAARYAAELKTLSSALDLYRHGELVNGAPKRDTNLAACACDCARRIRVSRSTLGQGPISCGLCGGLFEPVATSEAAGGDSSYSAVPVRR